MKFVLDTNAVSAAMHGDVPTVQRLAGLPQEDVTLPQPVVSEILYGIERLPPSRRRDWLNQRFARIAAELPRAQWSDAVSRAFAKVRAMIERQGQRIEDFDAAIAAHALANDAVLVTADARHINRVDGLRIQDWSRPPESPAR